MSIGFWHVLGSRYVVGSDVCWVLTYLVLDVCLIYMCKVLSVQCWVLTCVGF